MCHGPAQPARSRGSGRCSGKSKSFLHSRDPNTDLLTPEPCSNHCTTLPHPLTPSLYKLACSEAYLLCSGISQCCKDFFFQMGVLAKDSPPSRSLQLVFPLPEILPPIYPSLSPFYCAGLCSNVSSSISSVRSFLITHPCPSHSIFPHCMNQSLFVYCLFPSCESSHEH